MTQVGEGQEADEVTPPVMTFGAPTVGEVLAERYELAEHINDDSAGRQVWRGVDVILRRPVAVVLRYPGGDSAQEMLQAAVDREPGHPPQPGRRLRRDRRGRPGVRRPRVGRRRGAAGARRRRAARPGPRHRHRARRRRRRRRRARHRHGARQRPPRHRDGRRRRPGGARRRPSRRRRHHRDRRPRGRWRPLLRAHRALAARRGRLAAGPRCRTRSATRNGAIAAPRQVRAGVPGLPRRPDHGPARPAARGPPSADVLAAELGRLTPPPRSSTSTTAGPLRFTAHDEEGLADPPPPAGARKIVAGRGRAAGDRPDRSATSASTRCPTTAAPTTAAPTSRAATASRRPAGGTDRADHAAAEDRARPATSVRIVDRRRRPGERTRRRRARWSTATSTPAGRPTATTSPKFGSKKPGMGVLIDLEASPGPSATVQVSPRRPAAPPPSCRPAPTDPAAPARPATTKLVDDVHRLDRRAVREARRHRT